MARKPPVSTAGAAASGGASGNLGAVQFFGHEASVRWFKSGACFDDFLYGVQGLLPSVRQSLDDGAERSDVIRKQPQVKQIATNYSLSPTTIVSRIVGWMPQ
jgi:hypothetical protein